MSKTFQEKHQLAIQEKETPEELTTIDGQRSCTVYHKTRPLLMNFEYHLEKIEFEVFPDSHYDVILGLPWFRAHNPTIIWDTEEINTKQCNCPHDPHETDLPAACDYNWYR